MSDLWEQAQEAVGAGNYEQAHVLLANLLRRDRQHVDAWYLLSTIAPSTEQQEVFLQRVLKLDPQHADAQEQLATIQDTMLAAEPPPVMPISTATEDFEAQAKGDTLPPWLAEDAGILVAEHEAEATFELEPEQPLEEIPEWLREMPGGDWTEEAEEVPAVTASVAAAPAASRARPRRTGDNRTSPLMLGLVGATVVVLIVLIYVLVTMLPGLF